MTTSQSKWPTRDDYDFSMLRLNHMAEYEKLQTAKVVEDDYDIGRFDGAGLYTTIYKVTTHTPEEEWMVRCFCSTSFREPPRDIEERYQRISQFCHDHRRKASALIPVHYIPNAIKVGHIDDETNTLIDLRVLPVVMMPCIQGPSLGSFIAANYQNEAIMKQLCIAWVRMIRELTALQMAHGDLDLTNVLVIQQGGTLTLKLIDYDNVWVPTLDKKFEQTEYGHPNFQHPAFLPPNERPFDAEMDRFSALVIYLSIRALIFRPKLYEEMEADESRLLFARKDYDCEIQPSLDEYYVSRITHLRQLQILELLPYIDELTDALYNRRMPCALDNVPFPPTVEIREEVVPERWELSPVPVLQEQPPTPLPWEPQQEPWRVEEPEPWEMEEETFVAAISPSNTQRPKEPVNQYDWWQQEQRQALHMAPTVPGTDVPPASRSTPITSKAQDRIAIIIGILMVVIAIILFIALIFWLVSVFYHPAHSDITPMIRLLQTLLSRHSIQLGLLSSCLSLIVS